MSAGSRADDEHPGGERPLEADPRADAPGDRPGEQEHERAGEQIDPGARRARAEAVVDEPRRRVRQAVRHLDEVRDQDERPEHREAGDQRGHVREEDRPVREHAHVDERIAHAPLDPAPDEREHGAGGEHAERARRRPVPRSPSLNATSSAIRASDSRIAPGTSTRDCVLIGDSGTKRCTSTSDAAVTIAPSVKSQRQLRLSTISPAKTMPKPPPTPNTAETRPMPTPTRSGGNSSRMIANESGKTPPPAPAIARNAISDQMFQATAQPMQPRRKISERDREQPLLAVLVAEPADDRRRDRRDEQEHGQHPRRPGRRRVQLSAAAPAAPGRPSSA